MSAPPATPRLRDLVRKQEPQRLTDTLVVGAFIEARSCERFAALVPHLDAELAKFYGGLLKSESRHFQDYLKLAYQYGDEADVERTIEVVRAKEAELISSPDNEFRFHRAWWRSETRKPAGAFCCLDQSLTLRSRARSRAALVARTPISWPISSWRLAAPLAPAPIITLGTGPGRRLRPRPC